MSVTLDPAINGLVGSTTTQELDGLDFRIEVFWLAAETNTPWVGPGAPLGQVGAVEVTNGGSYVGGDADYPATQASTDGDGTGAEFTVTLAAGVITGVVSVDMDGEGYARDDVITILVDGPAETTAAELTVSLAIGQPGVWSCSVRAADGMALVLGQVLRHGVDILAGMTSIEGVPQGRLIAFDSSGNARDPGRNDLDPGSDVRLVYRTAEEVGRS